MLDVPIGDDEKSAMAKAWTRDPKLRPATARATTAAQQVANPMQDRIGILLQIRIACGLENRVSYVQPRRDNGLVAAGLWSGPDGRPGLAAQPGTEAEPGER